MSTKKFAIVADFRKALTKGIPRKVKTLTAAAERIAMDEIEMSVVHGSSLTGAPGQPWKTGRLMKSWKRVGSIGTRYTALATDVPYAPNIEHRIGGIKLRSKIGGFHSVKITFLNARRIMSYAWDTAVMQYND